MSGQSLVNLRQYIRSASVSAAQNPSAERFAKLSSKIHVLSDREIEAMQSEAAGRGILPACRAGCDACCHRLVEATLPEVLEALEFVRNNFSTAELEQLRERSRAGQEANRDFWACRSWTGRAACPFLREGLCTIYPVRPLSCRAKNSTDASVCERVYLRGEPLEIEVVPGQQEVQAANIEVFEALRENGISSGWYEIAPAVLVLLDHPEVTADLTKVNPKLEKTKLISELHGIQSQLLPAVSAAISDPRKSEVLELIGTGRTKEAIAALDRFKGTPFEALNRLVLPFQYESVDELEEWWHRYDDALAKFEEAGLPSQETFDLAEAITTYPLAYTAKDVKPFLSRFMKVLAEHGAKAYPKLAAPMEGPRRPGPLRLGFISHRLAAFHGSRWAFGWMANMPEEIETWAFNLSPSEDDISTRFRRKADRYFHLPYPAPQVAEIIRQFDLDALIFTDIGMSGNTIQLACFRLARKQFTAWGHPVTSGSPQIDYYLSSELMEPTNGQDHYTEQLVRLPNSGLTYPRYELRPSGKSATDFGLPETGFILFAQNALKLTPPYEEALIEIAERSAKPLVLLEPPGALSLEPLRWRFSKVRSKVVILPRQQPNDYLRLLELADVSLDCECWNGGNTTIEALTMGTPVVSIGGEFMRGRHALAFLPLAGVGDLVASSRAQFVEMALNREFLEDVKTRIDVEPLYEDPAPSIALAELLLKL